jgi:hypothetical protein
MVVVVVGGWFLLLLLLLLLLSCLLLLFVVTVLYCTGSDPAAFTTATMFREFQNLMRPDLSFFVSLFGSELPYRIVHRVLLRLYSSTVLYCAKIYIQPPLILLYIGIGRAVDGRMVEKRIT